MKKILVLLLASALYSASFACSDSKAKDKDKTKGDTTQVK